MNVKGNNRFFTYHLQKTFFIRCCDGSEFGTGFGCLQCNECDGLISSSNPRDEVADWSCGGCSKKRSGKECVAILDELNTKLVKLSKSADDNRDSISDFEKVQSRKEFLDIVNLFVRYYQERGNGNNYL